MKQFRSFASSHKIRLCCGALLAAAALQSCEKDILTGQPEWLGNSIYERLEEGIVVNDTLRTFSVVLSLIDDLQLKEVLSKTGSKTLFVATDEAYDKWFKENHTSLDQLSLAQKKMLLNNSMINNAYLIELMSNASGNPPELGMCMRRETASSIYDSVAIMNWQNMPVDPMLNVRLDTWSSLRQRQKNIRILKNDDAAPMIHFLPEFMSKNKITTRDLQVLTNDPTTTTSDSWISGRKVLAQDITCKNGYICVVDGVIESSPNMAEIIRNDKDMTIWSSILERFSTPLPATGSTLSEFQRLYNSTDTAYVLRYFSKASKGKDQLSRTRQQYGVPATLRFDPGLNQYMWTNNMGYDMHNDAAAMIVPTDAALQDWWERAGKGLRDEYDSLKNVPLLTISKLVNVNMLTSFVDAVPSKFGSIVDDSKVTLGITESDIVRTYMGCNGVVYLVNRVFAPSEYRSVVYPALAHQSLMGVTYYAIDNFDFGPYLNSMESKFSMILPYNDQEGLLEHENVLHYLDPCTYGQNLQTLWEFYYDEEDQIVKARRFKGTVDAQGVFELKSMVAEEASSALIKNRLADLIDNLIVVGDSITGEAFRPDQEYYKTKAGSILRVTGVGTDNMRIQGGYQMETGQEVVVADVYDMTNGGNGRSYGVHGDILPSTSAKSVYELLKERVANGGDSLFFKLLSDDESMNGLLLSKLTYGDNTYFCANDTKNKNIGILENYNYTIYIPSDTAVQRLIDEGYLPTWDDYVAVSGKKDYVQKSKDSIAAIIHNFVRYHIQDNSVYIGGESVNSTKFESGKLNPKNKRFFSLTVSADANGMTVTDQRDKTSHVVKKDGFYNKTCREYWIQGTSTSNSRSIYSSSNAVVHQIDGVLIFDPETQFVPWTSKLPAE